MKILVLILFAIFFLVMIFADTVNDKAMLEEFRYFSTIFLIFTVYFAVEEKRS